MVAFSHEKGHVTVKKLKEQAKQQGRSLNTAALERSSDTMMFYCWLMILLSVIMRCEAVGSTGFAKNKGNAMLADHILGEFQSFRDLGLDVYLYDYRGYGLPESKSRLKTLAVGAFR